MGRGDHQADLMLIAEAPGGQEDQQGLPFVGSSGEVLDRLLRDCGLRREEIYITNIIKCHPPGNRDPRKRKKRPVSVPEYETFLLKPRIIVCLGRVGRPADHFAGVQDHQAARYVDLPEKLCTDCDLSSFCDSAGPIQI